MKLLGSGYRVVGHVEGVQLRQVTNRLQLVYLRTSISIF